MDYQQRINARARAETTARALGWFSIGLGLAELVFAGPIARALGMRGREGLLRTYGVREMATGVGLLLARDKAPWLWGRVAGDALDLATLGAVTPGNRNRQGLALACGAVAGATVLDVHAARALEKVARKPGSTHDYGERSGFPMGVQAAHGAALADFEAPRDMRGPDALRPTVH